MWKKILEWGTKVLIIIVAASGLFFVMMEVYKDFLVHIEP